METNQSITIRVLINAPVEIVWKCWITPEDILKWNNASNDWHTTRVENDLRIGGSFLSRMEAKDGSVGFDFEGIYDTVENLKLIEYHLADNRKVRIIFSAKGNQTEVIETFDPENENTIELQRDGWQAILNNFKKHTEASI